MGTRRSTDLLRGARMALACAAFIALAAVPMPASIQHEADVPPAPPRGIVPDADPIPWVVWVHATEAGLQVRGVTPDGPEVAGDWGDVAGWADPDREPRTLSDLAGRDRPGRWPRTWYRLIGSANPEHAGWRPFYIRRARVADGAIEPEFIGTWRLVARGCNVWFGGEAPEYFTHPIDLRADGTLSVANHQGIWRARDGVLAMRLSSELDAVSGFTFAPTTRDGPLRDPTNGHDLVRAR